MKYKVLLELFLQYSIHIVAFMILCKPKYTKTKTVGIMTVCMVLGVLLVAFSGGLATMWDYFFLYYIASIIYFVILFIWLFEGAVYKKLFLFTTYVNLFFLCLVIPVKISYMLTGYHTYASIFIRYTIYGLLLLFYQKKVKEHFELMCADIGREWRALSFMSTLISVIFTYKVIDFQNYIQLTTFTSLGEDCLLFTLGFIAYVIAFRMLTYQMENIEMRQTVLKNQLLLQQIQDQEELLGEAKRIRHDFRHYNLVIMDYVQNKEYEALEQCVKDYEAVQNSVRADGICKNTIVNSILKIYRAKAQNHNIRTTFVVKIPTQIPVRDSDLIAILANAVENAINGCKESYKEEPEIRVTMHIKSDKMIILIKNTCKDHIVFENERPKTTHKGIGISSMTVAVERYKGSVQLSAIDGVFYCKLILNLS